MDVVRVKMQAQFRRNLTHGLSVLTFTPPHHTHTHNCPRKILSLPPATASASSESSQTEPQSLQKTHKQRGGTSRQKGSASQKQYVKQQERRNPREESESGDTVPTDFQEKIS